MDRPNQQRAYTSWSAPFRLRLASLWLLNTLASCAPTSHPFPDTEGDAPEQETDDSAFDTPRAVSADELDAGASKLVGAVVDASTGQLCGTNQTLDGLLGCIEAQITLAMCTSATCAAGQAGLPDWKPFVDAVQGATRGAVVAQTRDSGADPACQTTYVACVAANPTKEGIEQCHGAATACGFDTDAGPSIACSADFATCFIAKPFAYDLCIGAFRACENALAIQHP
jgi:hypothetical protein